jgi:hypothetical protein
VQRQERAGEADGEDQERSLERSEIHGVRSARFPYI